MRKPTFCGSNRVNVPDSGCDDCVQLLEHLEALDECCEEFRTWKDIIDAWKSAIDTWKTGINTWKNGIDSWKSEINNWKTSITNWQTTINNWKNAISTWKENIDTNGYNTLTHKPKINGVTVEGNKTSEDYLIKPISTADIVALTPIECYSPSAQANNSVADE